MKLTIAALSIMSATAATSLRRRLSFEKITGYEPGTQVTDHAAIDLDQRAIESFLADQTESSFSKALRVYENGAHSKSIATVTLTSPLTSALADDTPITGTSVDEQEVTGIAYGSFDVGVVDIKIQYSTKDIQDSYVGCRVGAVAGTEYAMTSGCFNTTGILTISGEDYSYEYDVDANNNNKRHIAGFSTSANDKMFVNSDKCPGCPYAEFVKYESYYNDVNYADTWATAAFSGITTSFGNSAVNVNFADYTLTGRAECAKKGTAYMNVYMYVIREMEDAIDDCDVNILNNEEPVHAWDEAVAFYSGSLEGETGSSDGKLLYRLAEKRCQNFKTCGLTGDSLEGTSKVNYDIFDQFALGQSRIVRGSCPDVREVVQRITALMAVPLIQGTLRYAYKVDRLQGAEKEKAEGAVFAAAVLPRLSACSASDAETVFNNMKVGASSTDFLAVKAAFENNYECLENSCADVGGLYDSSVNDYYEDAGPCTDPNADSDSSSDDDTVAVALGITFGIIAFLALGGAVYMARREKSGSPVFKPSKTPHPNEMS